MSCGWLRNRRTAVNIRSASASALLLLVAVPMAQAAPCLTVTVTGAQGGPQAYQGQAGPGTLIRYGDDAANCDAVRLQFDVGRSTILRAGRPAVRADQCRLPHPPAQRPQRRPDRAAPASLDGLPDRSEGRRGVQRRQREPAGFHGELQAVRGAYRRRRQGSRRDRPAPVRGQAARRGRAGRDGERGGIYAFERAAGGVVLGRRQGQCDPLHAHCRARLISRRYARRQRGDRRRRQQRQAGAAARRLDLRAGGIAGQGRRRDRAFHDPSGDGAGARQRHAAAGLPPAEHGVRPRRHGATGRRQAPGADAPDPAGGRAAAGHLEGAGWGVDRGGLPQGRGGWRLQGADSGRHGSGDAAIAGEIAGRTGMMRSSLCRFTRRQILEASMAFGFAGVTAIPTHGHAQTIAPRRDPQKPPAKTRDVPAWLKLPPTPKLPRETRKSGFVEVNGASLYFAQFGEGPPALLLHGGLANSNYWGYQVEALSKEFSVTVIDTRGHGRSPLLSRSFSYSTFAEDVVAVMDLLEISAAAIIGWSDGAITGLQLAVNRPDRVSRLFAFGANSSPDGLQANGPRTAAFQSFSQRCKAEYAQLSPHPERWAQLIAGLRVMWRTEPNFTRQMLAGIKRPVTISDGEYDEIIKRDHTEQMARSIPGARLAIQPRVSHFAMLQDPVQFNRVLSEFLKA